MQQTPTKTVEQNRKVTVREEEMVIAKLKIQTDRMETRLKKLEKEAGEIHSKIQGLVKQGKKEEAYFLLKKLKMTKDFEKQTRQRMALIDQQVQNIENTLDDVKFTQVLKESNRAIENLSKEIDMDEIRIAKELQEEGKMRREEIDALLGDEEEMDDLKAELDKIEKGMIEENFAQADLNMKPVAQNPQAQTQKAVTTASEQEAREALMN